MQLNILNLYFENSMKVLMISFSLGTVPVDAISRSYRKGCLLGVSQLFSSVVSLSNITHFPPAQSKLLK